MKNNIYSQDVEVLLERINHLYSNADADKAISVRCITSFFYRFVFYKYRNEEMLINFFRMYNDCELQFKYLDFAKTLLRRYKTSSLEKYIDACYDIVSDIEEYQSNRDLYFSHIQKEFDLSLTGINFMLPDDITNDDEKYIKKIEEKIKRYK